MAAPINNLLIAGDKTVLPIFLSKMYEMVDDPTTNEMISWGPTNQTFIVWNTEDFSRILLTKYFNHNNFSSFVRQLNVYGFKKVNSVQWEFANKVGFIRGEPQLMMNIHKKRRDQSYSSQISQVPKISPPSLTYHERYIYRRDIEKLKNEKQLQFELVEGFMAKQLEINLKKHVLIETYQCVLKNQRDITLSFSEVFKISDLDPIELENDKKRRIDENELERLECELLMIEEEMRPNSLLEVKDGDKRLEEEQNRNDLFWEKLLFDDDWVICTELSEENTTQI